MTVILKLIVSREGYTLILIYISIISQVCRKYLKAFFFLYIFKHDPQIDE